MSPLCKVNSELYNNTRKYNRSLDPPSADCSEFIYTPLQGTTHKKQTPRKIALVSEQHKEPFSLEDMSSWLTTTFMERWLTYVRYVNTGDIFNTEHK
jgi:hypothetical protein